MLSFRNEECENLSEFITIKYVLEKQLNAIL